MEQTPHLKNQLQNRIRQIWRNKIYPLWTAYQWHVIGGLVALIIIFGIIYLSLKLVHIKSEQVHTILDPSLQVIKYSAGMITFIAFVNTLLLIFQRQIRSIRLSIIRDHVVICGMGNKGALFTKAFYEDGYKVVVIDRFSHYKRFDQFRDLKLLFLVGDATQREVLRKARIHLARYLVVVCGDDMINAEIAVNARELAKGSRNKVLTCLVHITNQQLCNLLKEQGIMNQMIESFRMEFFNIYESGARQLLKEFPAFDENVDDSWPHLLVVGLGPMGESLTVHAAMLWRIAHGKTKRKLPITIVDKDADQKKEYLELRYSQLNDYWDLTPVTLDYDSPQFFEGKYFIYEHARSRITIAYVCMDQDSQSLSAALALFQHLRHEKVPIVVQMSRDAGLSALLQGEDSDRGSFANFHAFWLLDRKCRTDLLLYGTHEILAQAIHEDYVRIQKKQGKTVETNPSLAPWEELPENLKESNRRQADDIGKKLKAIHCDLENLTNWDAELFEFTPEEIEKMAMMEHQRWLSERKNEGWTYDSRAKDLQRKTSPALVDWDKLPEDYKQNNRETVQSLPIFLARAGFQIFRT